MLYFGFSDDDVCQELAVLIDQKGGPTPCPQLVDLGEQLRDLEQRIARDTSRIQFSEVPQDTRVLGPHIPVLQGIRG